MSYQLGNFEEEILLAVLALREDAYSRRVSETLLKCLGVPVSVGACGRTLTRLEEKGYLSSYGGGIVPVRGGRRKRYYLITKAGENALDEADGIRMRLRQHSGRVEAITPPVTKDRR